MTIGDGFWVFLVPGENDERVVDCMLLRQGLDRNLVAVLCVPRMVKNDRSVWKIISVFGGTTGYVWFLELVCL